MQWYTLVVSCYYMLLSVAAPKPSFTDVRSFFQLFQTSGVRDTEGSNLPAGTDHKTPQNCSVSSFKISQQNCNSEGKQSDIAMNGEGEKGNRKRPFTEVSYGCD